MGEHVLVLNIGSSSIKYRLVGVDSDDSPPTGLVERIGEAADGVITHTAGDGERYERREPYADHDAGLDAMRRAFETAGPDLSRVALTAVGHRVVHGGGFDGPALIDDDVIRRIEELNPLAPLHNPANLTGIRVARRMFPDVPHVAVFDTSFHHTLPPHAYTYAVPRSWTGDLGVRRYGFHGTSYAYVSRRAAEFLGRDPAEVNLIVLHLGNGASAAAIAGGVSVDTSMGMTPLEGLVMGTRSGDVDPALAGYLSRTAGLGVTEVEDALTRRGGMLALAGSGDMREVWRRVDGGEAGARLAVETYAHRLRKYVGAYYAVLGKVDAVVFTAGVGEHDARIRELGLAGLRRLGIEVDPDRNRAEGGADRFISPTGAEVPVLVIPTDEEREIAAETLAVVRSS